MKYLIIMLLLIGCEKIKSKEIKIRDEVKLHCETTIRGILRCENSEVICYVYYGRSLQCKWKDKK